MLVILECEGKEYTVLVRQARVPVGYHSLPEIPAGMLDGSGHFKGVAAEEIAEECNLVIGESELVDLTELAYGDSYRGIIPSSGGSDEFYRMFVFRREVEPAVLTELQGRLTGLLAEGEYIKLEIIPLEDLWKSTPDAKALCALALFDCLRDQGMLPESAQVVTTAVTSAAELVPTDQLAASSASAEGDEGQQPAAEEVSEAGEGGGEEGDGPIKEAVPPPSTGSQSGSRTSSRSGSRSGASSRSGSFSMRRQGRVSQARSSSATAEMLSQLKKKDATIAEKDAELAELKAKLAALEGTETAAGDGSAPPATAAAAAAVAADGSA